MSNADGVIASLHTGHAQLADLIEDLSEAQLTTPTVIGEWDVSQVISHLGSGAVITRNTIDAALSGHPNPGLDANKEIWAVWDAMGPVERRDAFTGANEQLLALLDSIDEATRESVRVDMGFLPAPVDLATALTFRLNEFALHSWDVRAFLDDAAVVEASAVPYLLEVVPMFLGFAAKPAELGQSVTLRVDLASPERHFGLSITHDQVSVSGTPEAPDGDLAPPAEAWLRLASGRLRREYTPEALVTLTGPVHLADLRRVFPGF